MNDEKLAGKAGQVTGQAKTMAGGVTGDDKLRAEGKLDELQGQAREAIGQAKEMATDAVGQAREMATEAVGQARRWVEERAPARVDADELREVLMGAGRQAMEFVRQRPLVALGVVAAFAFVIGRSNRGDSGHRRGMWF